jgi:SNF2 family DNA or RNA helicase
MSPSPLEQLKTSYRKLPNEEQRILQVLSVVFNPVNQTDLKDVLSRLNWKSPNGTPLSTLINKQWRVQQLKLNLIRFKSNVLSCTNELVDFLTYQTVDNKTIESIVRASPRPNTNGRYAYSPGAYSSGQDYQYRSELRNAFYLKKYDDLFILLNIENPYSEFNSQRIAPLVDITMKNYDALRFAGLPDQIKFPVLASLASKGQFSLKADPKHFDRLTEHYAPSSTKLAPEIALFLAEQKLFRGHIDHVDTLLSGIENFNSLRLAGWLLALQGDYEQAITLFEQSLILQRKKTRKRKINLTGLPEVFYLLALLKSENPTHHETLQEQIRLSTNTDKYNDSFYIKYLMGDLQQILQGAMKPDESQLLNEQSEHLPPVYFILFKSLIRSWLNLSPIEHDLTYLHKYHKTAITVGVSWYASESLLVLQKFAAQYKLNDKLNNLINTLKPGEINHSPLIDVITPQPQWQRSLIALKNLAQPSPETISENHPHSSARLVWQLENRHGNNFTLSPKEQKIKKNGDWSKGRAVALERLATQLDSFDYITAEDKAICNTIYVYSGYGYYDRDSYELDMEKAIIAAIDHPHIYWTDNPQTPVHIKQRAPELTVTKQGKKLQIDLTPFPNLFDDSADIPYRPLLIIREGAYRLYVVQYSQQHLEVAKILGESGLTAPLSAQSEVVESITAIAPLLTIHSDISVGSKSDAQAIESDPRLHIHLQLIDNAVKLEWYVSPFASFNLNNKTHDTAPSAVHSTAHNTAHNNSTQTETNNLTLNNRPLFRPGCGGETVFTDIAGNSLRATRNLTGEAQLLAQVFKQCHLPCLPNDNEYLCENLEDSLELLLQLKTLSKEVILFWPKGKAIKLPQESKPEHIDIKIGGGRDWFSIDGQLALDNGEVIAMERLLTLLHTSPGRFIQLGETEFISLTHELRKHLEAIARLSHNGKFNPLTAPLFDDITEGMQVKANKAWKQQLAKVSQAEQQTLPVPSTLQAQLRDYQIEGFHWLNRLSHWGAGACLADDMGLGKTLQSLALILTRAQDGPTLILAPTSVCMNWLDEAQRFAPTLRCTPFGTGNRQTQLNNAGPFDVIVCSYGLLQHEASRLADVTWHTIVADEAQAIKNPATKRSKAAMSLSADFKMITTGTPIENHLGELWNLFRFINPGLLDTLDNFNQRFAYPIEHSHDRGAKQHLKQLIQPFILRRMKTDVLTELPPRTEITLHVELSDEEKVFYEALRRQAVEKIQQHHDHPGQQHVKMLAEIMRLRRACCHPQLVVPDSTIPSSKLKLFGATVQELLDNRHKALVFSQFVSHLSILREYLDEQNISYQYLDGSTPIKKRKLAVDAFQRGEGDLFLISLKAGGAGLNLTAADYVIHMDPWWNPAVEDQASDRAHRLGQQRPVTIYRMVASGTIEEKIVNLHDTKRDLANSLLEGSEMAGKMSVQEILKLIIQ